MRRSLVASLVLLSGPSALAASPAADKDVNRAKHAAEVAIHQRLATLAEDSRLLQR